MLPTFLAQYAAGCYLAVAASAIRQSGWKYLRLMAVVSLCLAFLALMLIWQGPSIVAAPRAARYGLILGIISGVVWVFVNAGQGQTVRGSQRLYPAAAGAACLIAAIALAPHKDLLIGIGSSRLGVVAVAGTTILGAALLGTVTSGMLLGHRYLTDTDMSIAPLRRLARMYLAVVVCRIVWLGAASLPIWSQSFQPRGTPTWFWLMITIRGGVGVLGVGLFAWMIWDCVRRRATQSATAIFYLSMIFVFLGELAGQYLTRTEGLAM